MWANSTHVENFECRGDLHPIVLISSVIAMSIYAYMGCTAIKILPNNDNYFHVFDNN